MSVGINKYIEFAITLLQDELWVGFNNSYNGRSFRLKKQDRIQPEIYAGSNEFTEVFVDDNYDSIVHFDLDPIRPKISTSQATANVNIIFAINIGKIYGNSTRATEEAIRDINNVLINTSFQIENIVEYPDSLADYDITEKDESRFNMQPYYVIKFETICNYGLNAICEPVTPLTYAFNLSSSEGGTATSNIGGEGSYTINVNRAMAAYAIADTNYVFNQWLDNTNVVTQNPYPFVMKNNKDLVAQFIYILSVYNNTTTYNNETLYN